MPTGTRSVQVPARPPAREPARRSAGSGWRWLAVAAAAAVALGGVGIYSLLTGAPEPRCRVTVPGRTVVLSPAQAAAVSDAVAAHVRRGASVAAVATAIARAGAGLPDGPLGRADRQAVARALTGHAHAALTCQLGPASVPAEAMAGSGLTARAERLRDELEHAFGSLQLGGFAPGGVSSGHMPGSAHYEGRAIDVFFRPVSERSNRRGWAVAQWAVAHAGELNIGAVIYDDRIWSVRRSTDGWRDYVPPGGSTDNPVLRHLDHVHVEVLRGG